MSGYIILCSGSLVFWKAVHQEYTSMRSCEAEVRATNECTKFILSVRLRINDLGHLPPHEPIPLWNDSHACIDLSKSISTKGRKHLNLRENCICKPIIFGEVTVSHIAGDINIADLFTRELWDGAHFLILWGAFMIPHPNKNLSQPS